MAVATRPGSRKSRTTAPSPAPPSPVKRPSNRRREATEAQRLLSGRQVEQVYGLPYRTLYDLVTAGEIATVRFPGQKRMWFERAAVEALIARSRETR